ncbi:MAG: hypothetical protein ACO22O_12365 [bacterium]
MECPNCLSTELSVTSTFKVAECKGQVVRRRRCKACDHKWYTLQQPEEVVDSYRIIFHRPFKQNVQVKNVLP